MWTGCMAECLSLKITSYLRRNGPKQLEIRFICFFFFLGPIWHPQMDSKTNTKAYKWAGSMAQYLSLKISPSRNYQAHTMRRNGRKPPQNRFSSFFFPCWGHLGTLKWTQKGTQRPACRWDLWPNVLDLWPNV
jgi:hypothetical protein